VTAGLTAFASQSTAAQSSLRVEEERVPVAERQRPDVIAPPAKIAGFLVDLRVLSTAEAYQDRTERGGAVNDVLISVGPEMRVRREASAYFVDVTAGIAKDVSLPGQWASSRYLVLGNLGRRYGADNLVQLRVDLRKMREDPTLISDVVQATALYASRESLEALARHSFNRLTIRASAVSSRVRFLGADQARYSEKRIQVFPSYKLSGTFDLLSEVFAQTGSSSFDKQSASSSSSGALVGARFDDGIWRAELAVGLQRQRFENGTDRISPRARGHLRWNPTRLTTLQLEAGTQGGSRAEFGGIAAVARYVVASVDHELRRDIVVSFAAEVKGDNFEALGREDKSKRASASITYWATRMWLLRARAEEFQRRSSDTVGNFDRSRFVVSLERSF
jgi:hypothetical protein